METTIERMLPIGTKVKFHSGNFQGLEAVVRHLDIDSKDPRAIYGFIATVELSNGETGYIEKSEHYHKIK